MTHLFQAFVIVALVLAVTFFPFFPGGFDALSIPLSRMAWALGRVGVLLIPMGALWLLFSPRAIAGTKPRGWLVWLTLGTCSLVAVVLVVIAFAFGPLLASGTASIAGLLIFWLQRRLRLTTHVGWTVPSLLVVAPILVLTAQLALIEPIASRTRDRVIANSAQLIAEIERYHRRHGTYPVSIFALYGDVKPAVIGVQRYFYEPSGDAYNLIFEEPSPVFGVRRFVVYNPRDKQRLTVHETDRLLLDDAGLDADNAGYTLVESLPQLHWKRFTFRS